MSFAQKWMEVEMLLKEISQNQKDKSHVLSHMQKLLSEGKKNGG
jgi:hypothetical protein